MNDDRWDIDDDDVDFVDDEPDEVSRTALFERLAVEAIRSLIDREHAVVWPEVEAKLADRPHLPDAPSGISPHHLTNARRALLANGVIEEVPGVTKGGRHVAVYGLKNRRLRQTAFDRAAARKRMLQGRYLKWSEGTTEAPNLIGNAGESVVRSALRAAMATGTCIAIGGARAEVERLFGQPVPGGSLDAAAQYVLPNDAGGDDVITTPIEVKNLRQQIYPATEELFQLLDKAARLQLAHPNRAFVPVFVCRRGHPLVFRMAKHLGFFVVEFDTRHSGWPQPLLPHHTVTPEEILEVRAELGYLLASMQEANAHLSRQFQDVLPRQIAASAPRWAAMAPRIAASCATLRRTDLPDPERSRQMDLLYRATWAVAVPPKPWRHRPR